MRARRRRGFAIRLLARAVDPKIGVCPYRGLGPVHTAVCPLGLSIPLLVWAQPPEIPSGYVHTAVWGPSMPTPEFPSGYVHTATIRQHQAPAMPPPKLVQPCCHQVPPGPSPLPPRSSIPVIIYIRAPTDGTRLLLILCGLSSSESEMGVEFAGHACFVQCGCGVRHLLAELLVAWRPCPQC